MLITKWPVYRVYRHFLFKERTKELLKHGNMGQTCFTTVRGNYLGLSLLGAFIEISNHFELQLGNHTPLTSFFKHFPEYHLTEIDTLLRKAFSNGGQQYGMAPGV